MKRFLSVLGIFMLVSISINAQQSIVDTAYDQLKAQHLLNPDVQYNIVNSQSYHHHQPSVVNPKVGGCACYTPHDATWTLAMAPNDDGSTANIPIPFNFCLYGITYTSLWINNNGNVTFDSPYGTFSAVGFPSASYVMVAPFWADVDTRGIGEVWYKITPTSIQVNWESCGYYAFYTDKVNTFSVIITDGSDPVIGAGNNVAFCYQDMQWTTGDASGGAGTGFGGVPATVGCNKGDGTSFVQFGRFDSPGTAYFGPYATNNGVSWLDNQSFIFDACNNTNIAPTLAGGQGLCDTIQICVGDTIVDTLFFLSPEASQITTLTASSASPDFTILNITNGNTATLAYQLIGSTPGTFDITVNAVDDGVPVQNVTFVFTVVINPNNTPQPIITGDSIICPGENTILNVSGGAYDAYLWNTGGTLDSLAINAGGTYTVEVTLNGCKKRDSIDVFAYPLPIPIIGGDTTICAGDSALLNVSNGPYNIYSWSTGSSSISTMAGTGLIQVTVTDSNLCVGAADVNVVVTTPVINITAAPSFCIGDSILMTASPAGAFDTILWSNGVMGPLSYTSTAGTFIVDGVDSVGCHGLDTVSITLFAQPVGTIIAPPVCSNLPATFTFNNTGGPISAYHWDFGNLAASNDTSNISTPNYQYPSNGLYPITVVVTTANGCQDTMGALINVNPLPAGTIANIAVCQGHDETFNFVQTSTDSIVSYAWNLPSGTPPNSNLPVPTSTFNFGGPYVMSVIITNQYGCIDTITQPFLVRPQPVADFGVYPICISRFTFDAQVVPDSATAIIDWNLGDGTIFNNVDTSLFNHIYNGPGDYNVSLVVTDQFGCMDSTSQLVHVDDSLFIVMPNVLVQSSPIGNDKIDLEVIQPGFNLCINYTYSIFDRWGVLVFETTNDPYNPDLGCADCFRGKAGNGAVLTPGIYYYILKGNFNVLKSGFITIFD